MNATRTGISALIGLAVALGMVAEAQAAVCYRLPFSNPNLSDGWGSTKGRSNPHRGVDFAQPAGKAIPAAASGTVALITKTSCLGNVVVVKHGDGMYSGYAHMQAKTPLKLGAKVSRGQTIGKVGTTGTCTTGNHLHMTLGPAKESVMYGTTVDPYKYIQKHKCSSASASADEFDIEESEFDPSLVESMSSSEDEDFGAGDEDGALDGHSSEAAGCSTTPAGHAAGFGAVSALAIGAAAMAVVRRRRRS